MNTMLRRMRERRAELDSARKADDVDSGFTLIELLVVVVIIGILVAIAIPIYLHYTNGAKNKSAESDARNAVTTIEQCIADNAGVPYSSLTAGVSVDGSTGGTNKSVACNATGTSENFVVSTGNTLTVAFSGDTYTVDVTTAAGSKYEYSSSTGQLTQTS